MPGIGTNIACAFGAGKAVQKEVTEDGKTSIQFKYQFDGSAALAQAVYLAAGALIGALVI
mgnify:CR=1 FL=1